MTILNVGIQSQEFLEFRNVYSIQIDVNKSDFFSYMRNNPMLLKTFNMILDILSKRLYQFVEQTKYIIETDCMSEPTSFPIIYNNDTKES